MKLYLVHHVDVLPAQQDPQCHISPKGRDQADRLGNRFRALGVLPARILHSDKQWSIDTAERIAAKLDAADRTGQPAYPIHTGHAIAPFLADIGTSDGDIMMCGHVDYLTRIISHLICGDENRKVVEFRPGHGGAVLLEGSGNDWSITAVWRQDHPPG